MDLSEWEEKGDNEEHFSKTGLREINIQCKKKKKLKSHSKVTALGEKNVLDLQGATQATCLHQQSWWKTQVTKW